MAPMAPPQNKSGNDYVKVDKGDNGDDNAPMVADEEDGVGPTTFDEGRDVVGDPSSSKCTRRSLVAVGACCFVAGALFGGLAASIAGREGSSSTFRPAKGGASPGDASPPVVKNGNAESEKLAFAVDSSVEGQQKIQGAISDAFTVLEQVKHDKTSFTQGLSYGYDTEGNLRLFETTGLNGQSKVRIIDPVTFEVEESRDIKSKFFGEGSTFFTDAEGNLRLIEITWKRQTGFIYDAETLEQLRKFSYTTTPPGNEGWGITYDAAKQEFIVSDGSVYLYFWDRDTLAEKRKVAVTRFDGREQDDLNELEYMGGLVCCNIWYSDDIICVDPATGKSVREYDMSSLWPEDQRGDANVLNGIALGPDHVLLTGKLWDRMYKVVFPDWPTLFASSSEDDSAPEVGAEQLPKGGNKNPSLVSAVSYNFLRTPKGTQTIELLLHDLLQAQPSQEQDPSIGGDHSSLTGPRRALTHLSELMESDAQIHSSCHPVAHNLGRVAYQYFGGLDAAYDGMVGTEDARLLRLCNAAYLHGVIEFSLRDVEDVNDLASAALVIEEKVCRKLVNVSLGPWECHHGIGHGIVQRYRMDSEKYVIQKGIDACKQTAAPIDCENGLWMDHFAVSGNVKAMENRIAATDVMMGALSTLDESHTGNGDSVQTRFQVPPLPPTLQICSLATSAFDCFTYAASEYLLVHPGDYTGAARYCADTSAGIGLENVTLCVHGLATQCAKENMGDFSVVEEVCQAFDQEGEGNMCFVSALRYYMESSGGETPRDAGLCENLAQYKDLCEQCPSRAL